MYLLPRGPRREGRASSCSAAATILREVLAAAELLRDDFGVARRRLERDQLQRAAPRRRSTSSAGTCSTRTSRRARSFVEQRLGERPRVRWSPRPTTCRPSPTRSGAFVPRRYRVLGTDGFGRSRHARDELRHFFEVNRHFVALAALQGPGRRRARSRAAHGAAGDRAVRHRPGQAEPGRRSVSAMADRATRSGFPTSATSRTSTSSSCSSRRATASPSSSRCIVARERQGDDGDPVARRRAS